MNIDFSTILAQIIENNPHAATSIVPGVSDAVWLAFFVMIQTVVTGYFTYRTKISVDKNTTITETKAQEAHDQTQEVREAVRTVAHDARDAAQTAQLALKISDVKLAKLDELATATNRTQVDVNTAMDNHVAMYGALLKAHAETVRRLAESSGKQECLDAAERIEQQFKEFEAKQADKEKPI